MIFIEISVYQEAIDKMVLKESQRNPHLLFTMSGSQGDSRNEVHYSIDQWLIMVYRARDLNIILTHMSGSCGEQSV